MRAALPPPGHGRPAAQPRLAPALFGGRQVSAESQLEQVAFSAVGQFQLYASAGATQTVIIRQPAGDGVGSSPGRFAPSVYRHADAHDALMTRSTRRLGPDRNHYQ